MLEASKVSISFSSSFDEEVELLLLPNESSSSSPEQNN